MRRSLMLVMILTLGLLGPVAAGARAGAQEATPTDGDGRVPAPAECTVEPADLDELEELLSPAGTPIASPEAPDLLPIPLGERARAARVQEVEEVARLLVACLNAGDELRAASLFTDDGFLRFTAPASAETALEQLQEPPEARPEALRQRLIGVTNTARLEDGRIGAVMVINDPLTFPAGPRTLLLIFAKQGEEWLIDDFYGFSAVVPANALGTPTP